MATRKPDRIDRAAAKLIDRMSGAEPGKPLRPRMRAEPAAKAIAALVRREVKRERKAMREVVKNQSYEWGGTVKRELIQWLDAREAGR